MGIHDKLHYKFSQVYSQIARKRIHSIYKRIKKKKCSDKDSQLDENVVAERASKMQQENQIIPRHNLECQHLQRPNPKLVGIVRYLQIKSGKKYLLSR